MLILALIGLFFPLMISGMNFVDSDNRPFQLTPAQLTVLNASDLGQQLQEDRDKGNKVDFSKMKYIHLRATTIKCVLSHASNPEMLIPTTKIVPEEIALFGITLFVNRFDTRLAQLAHPTIGDTWGGDIHDRSWVIWPKMTPN